MNKKKKHTKIVKRSPLLFSVGKCQKVYKINVRHAFPDIMDRQYLQKNFWHHLSKDFYNLNEPRCEDSQMRTKFPSKRNIARTHSFKNIQKRKSQKLELLFSMIARIPILIFSSFPFLVSKCRLNNIFQRRSPK